MLRRGIVVLAVGAVVLAGFAWRDFRKNQEANRRFDCPRSLGSRLPPRNAPRSPSAPTAVRLVEVADLVRPVAMATRPNDDALYFAEQGGRVVRAEDGAVTTLIDLTREVTRGTEQGLLGLAFSPDGSKLYTNHTDREGDTHLTEWAVGTGMLTDRRKVLFVDQPHHEHNGGALAFGPDGMLYVGLGDGGGRFDPDDNAQSLGTLLGKVLRIDPRPTGSRAYTVPDDNPFAGRDGARPEIWAYGLRNPWRLTFDAMTGDLWIADVGDGCFEEIDLEPGGFRGGANYGWDHAEGHRVAKGPVPDDYTEPVYSYLRDGGTTCAVVGGYVYRGSAIPALQGWYVFGDLCHGRPVAWQGPGKGQPLSLGATVNALASFGVDQAGELYALSLAGEVYKLVPSPAAAP